MTELDTLMATYNFVWCPVCERTCDAGETNTIVVDDPNSNGYVYVAILECGHVDPESTGLLIVS